MSRLARIAALAVFVTACGGAAPTAANSPSSSPRATIATPSTASASPRPSTAPQPTPAPQVTCHGGATAGPMFLISSSWTAVQVLYDVTDPVRPRLLCKIANTSAHLFTGDTFEYLKPVSATETDVMLHSLGSGNESQAGKFPFYVTSGSWLADQTVMAYTMPQAVDSANYPNGGTQVWLYAQRRTALLYTYQTGIGDCICRFGLPHPVLAVSPDGQYLVSGWIAGKGSEPLAVYRVSDRSRVTLFDTSVTGAFWDRSGHRLFLVSVAPTAAQSWTPEAGVSSLTGAAAWSYLPGLSPDGSQVAYTAYVDPNNQVDPRIYAYDLKAGTTRLLVDQIRTQAIVVKDGWLWSLDERLCLPADHCAGATTPTGRVYAMDLSTGAEREITWGFGDDPHGQAGIYGWEVFAPGEFWPAT